MYTPLKYTRIVVYTGALPREGEISHEQHLTKVISHARRGMVLSPGPPLAL